MSASDGTQGVRDHQHEIERIREPQPHFTHEAPEHWSELAACASADPEAWFPPKGNPPAHAKAICRRCPVISECLEAALARNDQWGVYGGMSLRERNKLAKDRREAAA